VVVTGGDATQVAVLEPVAIAFEADHLGVVDEAKARRFVDSWLPDTRNPGVVVVLASGAGRVRMNSSRAAFGVGGLDVVHGGLGGEAEDAHEVDGVSGVPGFVEDAVLA
jgi:hypothetical protein